MLYFVYTLIDPRSKHIGYVGITNNPNLRMQQHLTVRESNIKKNTWIDDLASEGLKPQMRIVEIVESLEDARSLEKQWIQQHSHQDICLVNIQHVPTQIDSIYDEPNKIAIDPEELRKCLALQASVQEILRNSKPRK